MKSTIKLLGVLMILIASVSLAVGAPQTNATVNVSAAVGSTAGDGPVIQKMFVLADDDLLTPGTQVMPVPGVGNDKSYKDFNKYVIVMDPNGISDIAVVYEKLYYPNGTLVSPETTCVDITNSAEQDQALNDALKAGLITSSELTNFKWELDPLKQQAKMFRVENSLSNCDPAGSYQVYFKAVDNGGLYLENTTNFDYLKLKAIGLDFDSINYGSVTVNTEKWVAGDDVWGTPTKPTIKNEGNDPLQISVQGSTMTGDKLKQPLSAGALSVELLGQHVYGLASPVILTGSLQPCKPTQISFDIKAPLGTASDNYKGSVTIKIA